MTNIYVTINGGLSVSDGLPLPGSQAFSQFVGFGDSGIDTGYFFTHPISGGAVGKQLYQQAVAAGGGLPTDPGYPMNTTLLANFFGLTAIPYGEPGGTNYAASGATVTGNQINPNAPSIVQQINTYLSDNHGVANPTAIYYINGGGNSAKAAVLASSTTAGQTTYMVSEANSMAAALQTLYADGARYFVINDSSGPSFLGTTYNATLWADLQAANIPFTVADDNLLFFHVKNSPSSFGITNIIAPPTGPFTSQNPYDPANGGSAVNPGGLLTSSWALFATQDVSSTAANTYLYADDEHLSGAGQRIEANYTENVIQNAQPLVSQVLQATPTIRNEGTVTGSELTYQWQSEVDGQSTWSDILAATSKTYTVTSNDVGSHLRVEFFFNGNGDSESAISPATPVVTSATVAMPPSSAPQVFQDTPGNDTFQGGTGLNTVVYSGNYSAYTVAVGSANSSIVTGSGTDHLGSIERLQFSDVVLALDIQGNAGNAYRLYQAAFDRMPDTAGLSFWIHALDQGTNIQTVAQDFTSSAEFKSLYGGSNPSATTLIDLLYHNVLGRAPDQAGFDFWSAQLTAGTAVGAVLEGFAVSSENHALVDSKIAQGIVLDHTAFLV